MCCSSALVYRDVVWKERRHLARDGVSNFLLIRMDEKIVRHSDKSGLPSHLYTAHEMLWNNDIYGAKQVSNCHVTGTELLSTCKTSSRI